jgi:hypothetical protein
MICPAIEQPKPKETKLMPEISEPERIPGSIKKTTPDDMPISPSRQKDENPFE